MEKNKNRKDFILFIIAAILGIVTFLLLLPAPPTQAYLASHALKAGQILQESDVILQEVSSQGLPADVVFSLEDIIGSTLAMDRAQGDLIRQSALGEPIQLQPNERALAISVDDATGLAGLLKPGDFVGVTAVISNTTMSSNGTFSKATVENLRVLYLSPEFEAQDPIDPIAMTTQQSEDPNYLLKNMNTERSNEGIVLLAVPIDQEALIYHFSAMDPNLEDVEAVITAIELLALLDQSSEATLSLYLMPKDPIAIESAGIWLPSLVMTPGLTPTPTPTCAPDDEDCLRIGTATPPAIEELILTPIPTEVLSNEDE